MIKNCNSHIKSSFLVFGYIRNGNEISKEKTQDTIDAPATEEIEIVLKKLKNNKAPGTDSIPAELLKFGDDRLKQWLKHLFLSIWINEEIPKEWLLGITCLLHKKVTRQNVLIIEASLC